MSGSDRHPGLDALEQELAALKQVQEALVAEREALKLSAADQLESAITLKNQSLASLGQYRGQREQLLGRDQLRTTVTERMQLSAEQQAEALAVVDSLNTIGQECQHLNARNGQLIGGLRDMTEGALTVLRGEPTVSLYGQSGDRASDLGSRSLGTA